MARIPDRPSKSLARQGDEGDVSRKRELTRELASQTFLEPLSGIERYKVWEWLHLHGVNISQKHVDLALSDDSVTNTALFSFRWHVDTAIKAAQEGELTDAHLEKVRLVGSGLERPYDDLLRVEIVQSLDLIPLPPDPQIMRAVRRNIYSLLVQRYQLYADPGLEDKKRHFISALNAIERQVSEEPELRRVFEEHSFFQKQLAWQVRIVPDFPSDRFGQVADEQILDFLNRVWKNPYLYCGFATIKDIKRVDPKAFKAIPWPKISFADSGEQDLAVYLKSHWKDLIAVGLATRAVVAKDPSLEEALRYRLGERGKKKYGELPADLIPPTLAELNTRALKTLQIPAKHRARLVGTQATRLRRSRPA